MQLLNYRNDPVNMGFNGLWAFLWAANKAKDVPIKQFFSTYWGISGEDFFLALLKPWVDEISKTRLGGYRLEAAKETEAARQDGRSINTDRCCFM